MISRESFVFDANDNKGGSGSSGSSSSGSGASGKESSSQGQSGVNLTTEQVKNTAQLATDIAIAKGSKKLTGN